MAIIDETYFIGNISLPTDNDNYLNKLNKFINITQKKYLLKAFGYELYALFIAELPIPTSQRFTDILDGAEFENTSGYTDKWDGLANSELESFLAYFTYIECTNSNTVSLTGQGATTNMFENANPVAPIPKGVEAFNLGVKQYNKLYDFMKANQANYPEWQWTKIGTANIFNL